MIAGRCRFNSNAFHTFRKLGSTANLWLTAEPWSADGPFFPLTSHSNHLQNKIKMLSPPCTLINIQIPLWHGMWIWAMPSSLQCKIVAKGGLNGTYEKPYMDFCKTAWVDKKTQRLLLGLEYKSRGFSRKLRPGELLHGHNSVNSQQILMGLRGTLPISLDRVYPKYQNDW